MHIRGFIEARRQASSIDAADLQSGRPDLYPVFNSARYSHTDAAACNRDLLDRREHFHRRGIKGPDSNCGKRAVQKHYRRVFDRAFVVIE